MKIIISGALGRMGRALAELAKEADIAVVCGVDAALQSQMAAFPLVKTYKEIQEKADVLIDFSVAGNLETILQYALQANLPLVLCTTGYTQQQQQEIEEASKQIPILQSANMSLGVHVMAQLAAMAARILGGDYDIEIIEKHHNHKLDSPSGTALMLSEEIQKERGSLTPVYGRQGRAGKRQPNEIGIHAVRGGTVAGEHEVGFYGSAEEILITHRAENRTLFAKGALRAAEFLKDQNPGRYTMKDAVASMMQ